MDAPLSKLRHLYANMVSGAVRDAASAERIATGLLGPAIVELERLAATRSEAQEWVATLERDLSKCIEDRAALVTLIEGKA